MKKGLKYDSEEAESWTDFCFESFTPYDGMEGRIERIWITKIATDGNHLVRLLAYEGPNGILEIFSFPVKELFLAYLF